MAGFKKQKPGRPKTPQRMRLVGIRLQETLLERLKSLASSEGLPYQTYLRKVVWDHVFKHVPKEPTGRPAELEEKSRENEP